MADDEKPLGVVGWMLAKNRNGFVRPRPAHAQTPAAQAARDALRAFAAANPVTMVEGRTKRVPVAPAEVELVTHHVPPWHTASTVDMPAGSARTFAYAALAAGHGVGYLVAGDAVEVRVKTDAGTIRAWWKAGRTTGVVYQGRKITLTEAKGLL